MSNWSMWRRGIVCLLVTAMIAAILIGNLSSPPAADAQTPPVTLTLETDQEGPVAADTVVVFYVTIDVGDVGLGNISLTMINATPNCSFSSGVYVGPNTRLTCRAEYVVTETDAANGSFTTTATFTGTNAVLDPPTATASQSVTVLAGEGLPTPTPTPSPTPTPTPTPIPTTLSYGEFTACFNDGSLNNGQYTQDVDIDIEG
jgi:hypothetical protein